MLRLMKLPIILLVLMGLPAEAEVTLKIEIAKPPFSSWKGDIRTPNLEPFRFGKPRPPIVVPDGCDKLISRGCKVSASIPSDSLACVTDGFKEYDSEKVELAPGVQWIQVDLGAEHEIYAVCIWHYHGEPCVYRDVICQISNDKDFINGVQTVFNNDHDNTAKLGAGRDKEYIETFEGRPFACKGVKGRYVRFYSNGNTANAMNHYTEVEVYGK
ncbi:MAG: discoidin domain-containing protein [Kiritimatiellae bacterium]|nr:discoidin domain-containing protein [Kiritimatiellia bacterium]